MKDEKAKVDRDNLTNRLLFNGDNQALNELDKALKDRAYFFIFKTYFIKKGMNMSLDFILIIILASWLSINELRLRKLEKKLKEKK